MAIPSATGARAALPQGEPMASPSSEAVSIDAWLLAVLEDEELRQQVRQLKKVELSNVWQLTRTSLMHRHDRETSLSDPLDVHRRLKIGRAHV